MSVPAEVIQGWEKAHGVNRMGPIVRFFDHAVPINKSAREFTTKGKWKGERPRFKAAVFVEMKTRNDPTGSTFREKATDEHKEDFPREWAAYQTARESIEKRSPPLAALPDMNPAYFEELRALGITDCRELAQYDKNLDELAFLRKQAVDATRIFDENSNVGQRGNVDGERENVPESVVRPIHGDSTGISGYNQFRGDNGQGPLPSTNQGREPLQDEATEKRPVQDTPVSFSYEFNL